MTTNTVTARRYKRKSSLCNNHRLTENGPLLNKGIEVQQHIKTIGKIASLVPRGYQKNSAPKISLGTLRAGITNRHSISNVVGKMVVEHVPQTSILGTSANYVFPYNIGLLSCARDRDRPSLLDFLCWNPLGWRRL